MRPGRAQLGFTLVELIAVIVVLAVLAAVAVPKYFDMQKRARISAVTGSIKAVYQAQRTYERDNGPVTGSHWIQADIPTWLTPYLDNRKYFQTSRAYGGQWFFYTQSTNYAEIGLVSSNVPADEAAEIDAILDDGNLTTGRFRQTGYGYFYYHWDPSSR